MTNRRVLVAFGVALILASLAMAASPRARNSQITIAQLSDRTPALAIQLPGKNVPTSNLTACSALYDQSANGYSGIGAQNFEAAYNAYDVFVADNFTVPAGGWVVDGAIFPGIFWNGYSFNITGVNVWFYTNAGGHPGTEMCFYQGVLPEGGGSAPNVEVHFCTTPCTLPAGEYFYAVQVDLMFGTYGQWGNLTHVPVVPQESNWKNPNGGFGLPCPNWNYRCSVCGVCTGGDDDFAFTIADGCCSGGGGGGGSDCDLTPIETKLDDETRFTDDSELAVIEGKLDNIAIDWCDLIDLLLPILGETLPTTHPCYP
jgi:hypothetical protein